MPTLSALAERQGEEEPSGSIHGWTYFSFSTASETESKETTESKESQAKEQTGASDDGEDCSVLVERRLRWEGWKG